MNNVEKYQDTIFESIKHIDDNGVEYWLARELLKTLEYGEYRKFKNVLNKAMVSCKISGGIVGNHFAQVDGMVEIGSKSKRVVEDYKLTRYACYLIVQNADPSKRVVALGQTYFAVQTRKQEINEAEWQKLSEDEKRLYTRISVTNKNKILFVSAKEAGVNNFAKFNNSGYKGLYNGETAKDINKRKGLNEKEDILDYMGSEELGANLFRITQTDAKLKKDNINNEEDACNTHYKVGKTVRKAIQEIGGTMPEKLPTPDRSIKQVERDSKKELEVGARK